MSTWYSKHVEENIWRINSIKCITLVFLYGQFMIHGQRNIKLSGSRSGLGLISTPARYLIGGICTCYSLQTDDCAKQIACNQSLLTFRSDRRCWASLDSHTWRFKVTHRGGCYMLIGKMQNAQNISESCRISVIPVCWFTDASVEAKKCAAAGRV